MRRAPLARLVVATALVVAAASGCKSPPAPYSPGEERPRVAAEARWWEEQGNNELTRAWATESPRVRERHFAIAVRDFMIARSFYYEELEALENAESTDLERMRPYPGIKWAANGPIPNGRREALEIEIDRLSAEINQLARERPIEPLVPLTISEKVLPVHCRSPR
jgi:hypothetical protein